MNRAKKGLGVIIVLAPVIFVAHFLEESPGFVSWFNEHVRNGITQGLFWKVNISALVITIIVMLIELFEPSMVSTSLVVLWFSFLMLANAIFHITGAIVDQRYMPGLITAVILYLPYYSFVIFRSLRKGRLNTALGIFLAILGSSLMLVHGYLIIFRGSRLF
ncbi:MAG TPA: HXXEE domain-containing protein [Chitinophagaceae bacterium]|nr:HXXEE domain-containing protein [Chitinophagaceae bacterium]